MGFGITALAAYQGFLDTMADRTGEGNGGREHLDATGDREVVFCHQCEHEWYHTEGGLTCPHCESEITEIVRLPRHDKLSSGLITSNDSQITPESDPREEREQHQPPIQRPETPPGLFDLRGHRPWPQPDLYENDSDPEEADIEEHITHGPQGSMTFTQVRRSGGMRNPGVRAGAEVNPENIMRDFQNMIGSLVGQPGPTGRSGQGGLFGPGGHQFEAQLPGGGRVIGGQYTFTSGGANASGEGRQPGNQPNPDPFNGYDSP